MARLRIQDMRIVIPRCSKVEAEQIGRRVAAELAKLAPSLSAHQVERLRVSLDEKTARSPAAIARAIREQLG